MRVIETNHVHLSCARIAHRPDVIAWIDEEPARALGKVQRAGILEDRLTAADQHAATLARRFLTRVSLHIVQHPLDEGDHSASTAMAMPIPPPMHSEATPYRSWRARSA